MKINLTGKTAIVTGSTAGIGWGCARGLAGAGATVVLAARAEDALAKAREKLRDAVPGGLFARWPSISAQPKAAIG